MTWRKSRPPARQPHPNPGTELELQRILDLRASVGRRADLVKQYRKEIGEMHATARGENSPKRMEMYLKETEVLHQRIMEVELTITTTHKEIAALTAKMSDDDLAFL